MWRGRIRVASKLSAQRFLFSVPWNWKSTTSFLRANRLLVPPLCAKVLQKSNIKIVTVYESWIPSWQQDCCKVSGFTNRKRRARVLDGTDARPSNPLGEVDLGAQASWVRQAQARCWWAHSEGSWVATKLQKGDKGTNTLSKEGTEREATEGNTMCQLALWAPISHRLQMARKCHSRAPSFKACLGLARLCWRVWRKDHPVNPAQRPTDPGPGGRPIYVTANHSVWVPTSFPIYYPLAFLLHVTFLQFIEILTLRDYLQSHTL